MRRVSGYFTTTVAVGCALIALSASSALAIEGIASEGKSLGGLDDRQCIRKVDRVIAQELRNADNLLRVVRSGFTRRVFYDDGSVDFACFPDQVVVTVYFNNAGDRQAERDLRKFLTNF